MPDSDDKLSGMHVLVVEDELMIAMAIEEMLEDLHMRIIGPVASVEAALDAIEAGSIINCVLLDLNLQGNSSLPIAQALIKHSIPFIVVTGYGRSMQDPPELRNAPRLIKPFNFRALTKAMTDEFVE